MSKLDIVKSAIISHDNVDKSYLYSDDFQVTDSVGGQPMDKNAWLGMTPLMLGSFPDIEYVVEDLREEPDGVFLAGHFVGTFTHDLDLSMLGIGVIPASGKKITWPTSSDLITVENGKITKWHGLDTGPDAGLSGFLRVLGVG